MSTSREIIPDGTIETLLEQLKNAGMKITPAGMDVLRGTLAAAERKGWKGAAEMCDKQAQYYRDNDMYPAYGLNSRESECEQLATRMLRRAEGN